MNKKTVSNILVTVCAALVVGAVITLVPFAGASKQNIAGYRSLCTFSPVSTVIMLFASYSLNGIRLRKCRS